MRGASVFQHLTSHFLPIFIGGRCPKISVNIGTEERSYPDAINEIVRRKESEIELNTDHYGSLRLTLLECLKSASSDLKGSNFDHFIAHERTVHSQCIDGMLGLKSFGCNNDRVFHAILTGAYLYENVNQERTAFMFEDVVIESIIHIAFKPYIEEFLADPLEKLRSQQTTTIQLVTETYPSLNFGSLEELQKKLPSGELNPDAIFGHLSRERYRRDQRQAEKIKSVFKRLKNGEPVLDDFKKAIEEASKAIEDTGRVSLAEYIVRRKVILDFMEFLLRNVRDDTLDSSYQREEILHSFICPMKVSTVESDSKKVTPATSHELWIVDERLTFARYFSSDIDFSTLADSMKSADRPDLLIFDRLHSLCQAAQSSKIMLVEFKRPGREKYADGDNPQHQVERYIQRLQSGSMKDILGRPMKLNELTVFNCFIVADIVGKLDEWTYSWQPTADGRGKIYQPANGFRGSIELIGWDALLADARERNQAFFEQA